MQRKALQKAIDALNVGTPDKICFALGILETLIESLPEDKLIFKTTDDRVIATLGAGITTTNIPATDEASILDAQARAAIEKMKAIGELNKLNKSNV